MKVTTSMEDGGLWSVWRGKRKLGYIWNEGYSRQERVKDQWHALDDWIDGVEPGLRIGTARTWNGALALVVRWRRYAGAVRWPRQMAELRIRMRGPHSQN